MRTQGPVDRVTNHQTESPSFSPAAYPRTRSLPVAPVPATLTLTQAQIAAQTLYDAGPGGWTGLGTDEERIVQTLKPLNASDVDLVKAQYQRNHPKSAGLEADLVAEFSDSPTQMRFIGALLKGKQNLPVIRALEVQTQIEGGLGDIEQTLSLLETLPAQERQHLAAQHLALYPASAPMPNERSVRHLLFDRFQTQTNATPKQLERLQWLLLPPQAPDGTEHWHLGQAHYRAERLHQAYRQNDLDQVDALLGGTPADQLPLLRQTFDASYARPTSPVRKGYAALARHNALTDNRTLAERIERMPPSPRQHILRLHLTPKPRDPIWHADLASWRLDASLDGINNVAQLRELLTSLAPEQRKLMRTRYDFHHPQERLDLRLKRELNANDFGEIQHLLSQPGAAAGSAEQLAWQSRADAWGLVRSMAGLGTDEAEIQRILAGKDSQRLAKLAADYHAITKDDLQETLAPTGWFSKLTQGYFDELRERERLEVEQLLTGTIDPEKDLEGATRQQIGWLRAQHLYETQDQGVDLLDQSEKLWRLDFDHVTSGERWNNTLAQAQSALDKKQIEQAQAYAGLSTLNRQSYLQVKDQASGIAAYGTGIVVSTVVLVGTGGLAGAAALPLVMLGAGAAGAATTGVTRQALNGQAGDSLNYALVGGVSGATLVAPFGAFVSAGRAASGAALMTRGTQTFITAPARVASQGMNPLEWIVMGGTSGGLNGGATQAAAKGLQDETWRNGLAHGMAQVLEASALGIKEGLLVGAAFGGLPLAAQGLKGLRRRAPARVAEQITEPKHPSSSGPVLMARQDKAGTFHIETPAQKPLASGRRPETPPEPTVQTPDGDHSHPSMPPSFDAPQNTQGVDTRYDRLKNRYEVERWVKGHRGLTDGYLSATPHQSWLEDLAQKFPYHHIPRIGAFQRAAEQDVFMRDGQLWIRDAHGATRSVFDPSMHLPGRVVANIQPSPDGRFVVLSHAGADQKNALSVLDMEAGELLPGQAEGAWSSSVTWYPDAAGTPTAEHSFFYTPLRRDLPPDAQPYEIQADKATLRRWLDGREEVIFDPRQHPELGTHALSTRTLVSDKFAVLEITPNSVVHSAYFAPLDELDGPHASWQRLFAPQDRVLGMTFGPDGHLIVAAGQDVRSIDLTRQQGPVRLQDAPLVVEIPPVVAMPNTGVHPPVTSDKHGIYVLVKGLYDDQILHIPQGDLPRYLDIPVKGAISNIAADAAAPGIRFDVKPPLEGSHHFQFDPHTGRLEPSGLQKNGGMRFDGVIVETLHTPASPGRPSVPISVFRRPNTPLDGNNPLIASSYPAYGAWSHPPTPLELAAVQKGGIVYTVIHARGSGVKGDAWYLAGGGTHVGTAVQDVDAALAYLFDMKYSSPGQATLRSWSSGGMLGTSEHIGQGQVAWAIDSGVVDPTQMAAPHNLNYPYSVAEYGNDVRTLESISPMHALSQGPGPLRAMIAGGRNDRVIPPSQLPGFVARVLDGAGREGRVLMWLDDGGHVGDRKRELALLSFALREAGFKVPPSQIDPYFIAPAPQPVKYPSVVPMDTRYRGEDLPGHPAFQNVRYFDLVQRDWHEIEFVQDPDGLKMAYRIKGSHRDGRHINTVMSEDGLAIVVMDEFGKIYVRYQDRTYSPPPNVFTSSSFLAGGPVAFEGQILVPEGILRRVIQNRPGKRYATEQVHLEQFLAELAHRGVDTSKIRIEIRETS